MKRVAEINKEDINERCKYVTAMKFKGHINARIYCKELKWQGTVIVIAAELLKSKKSQKNRQKEINLIEKVAGYNYEIEQ